MHAGQERATWSQAPAPVEVTLFRTDDGTETQLVRALWPQDTLDLGVLTADRTWSFRAEFRDASGALVMAGRSPPLATSSLAGVEVPLLCGRLGQFTRPVEGLATGRASPLAGLSQDRYLLVTGAATDPTSSELYDLATLSTLVGSRALPRAPRGLLTSRSGVTLLVDDQGATALDLTTGESATASDPLLSGASGGQAIDDGDGGSFLVGATRRQGEATSTVVRLSAAGEIARLSLPQPRLGAAAAWVAGTGLVVAGGAAEAAVEVLAPGASSFVTTGVVLPAVTGATLAPLANGDLVLAGGDGATTAVRFSLACSSGCPPTQSLALGVGLVGGRGHALSGGRALLVGESAAGTTALLVSPDGPSYRVEPVALRSPRRGATSVRLDGARVAVLGGLDDQGAGVHDVEIFTGE